MQRHMYARTLWIRFAVFTFCGAACLLMASCGGTAGLSTDTTPITGTTSTSATPITSTTPSTISANVHAGDGQNGKSITLHPGQVLVVTLSSTYWSFQGSSDLQVLAPVGAPVASPAPRSVCPVVGSGCGTVSLELRALAPGTAQVTASRVSCGEAMGCEGAAGLYHLSVQVTATSQ